MEGRLREEGEERERERERRAKKREKRIFSFFFRKSHHRDRSFAIGKFCFLNLSLCEKTAREEEGGARRERVR